MAKPSKPMFGAIPLRALADRRLNELHFRMLGIIAVHDRMSLPKGAGQGCWASSGTMAEEVGGYHLSNVSTAISELQKFGYLQVEKRPSDKRLRVYRVVYDDPDSLPQGQTTDHLPQGQTIAPCNPRAGAETDRDSLPTGNRSAKVVCPADDVNDWSSWETQPQYISQSDVRNLAEATEIDSAEAAQREIAQRGAGDKISGRKVTGSRRDPAEAGHPRKVSISAKLGPNMAKVSLAAQLCRFEEELAAINREFGALSDAEQQHWTRWLNSAWANAEEPSTEAHAVRLAEEVAGWRSAA